MHVPKELEIALRNLRITLKPTSCPKRNLEEVLWNIWICIIILSWLKYSSQDMYLLNVTLYSVSVSRWKFIPICFSELLRLLLQIYSSFEIFIHSLAAISGISSPSCGYCQQLQSVTEGWIMLSDLLTRALAWDFSVLSLLTTVGDKLVENSFQSILPTVCEFSLHLLKHDRYFEQNV